MQPHRRLPRFTLRALFGLTIAAALTFALYQNAMHDRRVLERLFLVGVQLNWSGEGIPIHASDQARIAEQEDFLRLPSDLRLTQAICEDIYSLSCVKVILIENPSIDSDVTLDLRRLREPLNALYVRGQKALESYRECFDSSFKVDRLVIQEASLSLETMLCISRISQLTTLDLYKCRVEPTAFSVLAPSRGLDARDSEGDKPSRPGSPATGLPHFAHLEDLKMPFSGATDEHCVALAECRTLRCIDLSGCAITSTGLKSLRPLPELIHLNLAETAIDEEGLEALLTFPQLQQVRAISSPHLTQAKIDAFAEKFSTASQLRYVNERAAARAAGQ